MIKQKKHFTETKKIKEVKKMIKLNKNTKKAKQLILNYENSNNAGNLYEVYNSISSNKYIALERCKDIKAYYNGYNPTIPTNNTFVFTYAFLTNQNDKTNLVYITPNNDYIIEL